MKEENAPGCLMSVAVGVAIISLVMAGYSMATKGMKPVSPYAPPAFCPGDRVMVEGREVIVGESKPAKAGRHRFTGLQTDGKAIEVSTDEATLIERARWGIDPNHIELEAK